MLAARRRTTLRSSPIIDSNDPPRPDVVLDTGLSRSPCNAFDVEDAEAVRAQRLLDSPAFVDALAGQDLENDVIDQLDRVARTLQHFDLESLHVDLQQCHAVQFIS